MSPATTAARRSSAGPRKTTRKRPPARPGRPRRRRPRRLRDSWPILAVAAIALVLLVGLTWDADREAPAVADGCRLPASDVTLSREQVGNARTIAQVGRDRGLPERAVVIALATAMQESTLRNLDHGDRDSLGLFQQRPSQGWGTPEQVQDPVHAAGTFYDHLVLVPGWETGELTVVADAVQRSAFPRAYQRWSTMAGELAAELRNPESMCR